MKKLAAFFLAAVLVMGLAVTAFAADSPSTINASATISDADQAAVDDLTADATGALTGAGLSASDASGYNLYGTYSLDSFDTNTAVVTISVPGLTTSDSVIVLQYINGAWVQIDASLVTVNDGSVTVIVSSDGPLAVYVSSSAAVGTGTSSTSTDSTGTGSSSSETSPTTGEAPIMAGFAAIVAIAAAGMIVTRKRHFA